MSWLSKIRRACSAPLIGVAVFVFAAVVAAQAQVRVTVRNSSNQPVDGRVVLTPQGGSADAGYRCTTSGGACVIADVPGGLYTLRFAPNEGDAPRPRQVAIGSDGSVDLRIALP